MNRRLLIATVFGLTIIIILFFVIGNIKKSAVEKKAVHPAEVLYSTALSLQSKDNLDEALKTYQQLVNEFPEHEKAAWALYRLGEIYEKDNLLKEAKAAYSTVIADFPNFRLISEVEKRLWDVNVKILFSPVVNDKDFVYKVEPGDTLSKIARKYNTTVELIMHSNNLKSDLIRPGQRLKISAAKYSVIVDKSQNILTLRQDEVIFKVYPVATGKYNSTPTGTFTIVEKLKNPDWYKRGEGIISADDPKNVLGTRWLGFSEPQYGIHGGASEEDIGNQVTEGCVRTTNADVEELFEILPRGAAVTIVD